ncbi:thioredoxin family protein [Lacticaseibacillus hegangensis]|uniref:Thioredoxin n=1 Tax=Lacticaseibacillus hegangensis TaxID=2486010 RepID=A0ABW4CVD6_9LACO|nr:thioredoxin domain-containing protein [Lacticaseibacillus hegangensis]
MPTAVTSETMTTHLSEGLTVVDLWAEWCGPCKILSPLLAELEQELPMRVLTLDVEGDTAVADQFHVQSIPTMLLYWQGKPVEKVTGAYPKAKLRAHFTQFLEAHDGK